LKLGGYTFAELPDEMPEVIQEGISVATVKTMEAADAYIWPSSYAGETIPMHWDYMTTSQYASLLAIDIAGAAVTFDPEDGTGNTFTVVISRLKGAYFIKLENAAGNRRRNVTLDLFILAKL
jgi:hypothetical protein